MLGHMSGAYTARVSRDLALSSRFDFNVYSYESEWTMGVEWWLRRSLTPRPSEDGEIDPPAPPPFPPVEDVQGVVKARASTNNVRSRLFSPHSSPLIDSTGRFPHVGGQAKKYARQLGRSFRFF